MVRDMFEISTTQLKNCIMNLEKQEKELNNLIQRMETVYTDFEGLAEDKSDKRALRQSLEGMQVEKRNIAALKQTLTEIVHCYETTESRLVDGKILQGTKNHFGPISLRHVEQMLDDLNIVFR